MSSPSDEWSGHVDIVRRALAVLAEETRRWVQSTTPITSEQQSVAEQVAANEVDG
jgi:hypothetical protein